MGAESVGDCIADIPSLYQDSIYTQASYGHGTQAAPAASATVISSPGWYPGIYPPLRSEAQSGCTVGTYHSPYEFRHPEGHTSDVSDPQTSLMCEGIGPSVTGNSSIQSQWTDHERGQGASFALPLPLPLPTRTQNLCPYLPSQDADSRSEGGSSNVTTMYNHQPQSFEATYDIGPAYAGSYNDLSGPYLGPYTEPQSVFSPPLDESHSHIIENISTRTNSHIPSPASRFTTIPPVQATGSRALRRPARPLPLLPSSSGPGAVNVLGHETPARSQITSPCPRRPSSHTNFLPYNLH